MTLLSAHELPNQAATGLLRVIHQPSRRHRRDGFIVFQSDSSCKTAAGERAAQPAGAQSQVGGKEDGFFHRIAEIFHVHFRRSDRPSNEGSRASNEAVSSEAFQVAVVFFGGGDKLETHQRTERPERQKFQEMPKLVLCLRWDGLGQIFPAGKPTANEVCDRLSEAHGIVDFSVRR